MQKSILDIDWETTKTIKYDMIKQKLQNIKKQGKDVNILINGEKEYIEMANEIVEKIIKNTNIQKQINILNCYNVTGLSNVSEIASNHDFIINTSGVKKTEEGA